MTCRSLLWLLAAWALVTLMGSALVRSAARIDEAPAPAQALGAWALDHLEAARLGAPRPEVPAGGAYRASGPVIVLAWLRGSVVARHVGRPDFVRAIDAAARAFAADTALTELPHWTDPRLPVRFTVAVVLGEGPILTSVPLLDALGVVPLREGLRVSIAGRDAWLVPDELLAEGALDTGIQTPIPDLTLGIPLERVVDRMARELGHDVEEVDAVRRVRVWTFASDQYPSDLTVDEVTLRSAAADGALFLLRHQRTDGSFTYLYDARTGRGREAGYSLARHAGAAYFLAQIHRLQVAPAAREGARRAIAWIARQRLEHCGGPERLCVSDGGRVEVGAAALTAIAAAELLSTGDDAEVRALLQGLTAFLRGQRREDGELMHVYDLARDAPVDVQYLYYSGEAALALLRAHEVLGDDRDLDAARGLMTHLTGAGWSFFGSRYYYGEEHWTCIAAGAAAGRVNTREALGFCRRWADYNRLLQYVGEATPWPVEGAYGVGPVILPRVTPVASRTEAFISTYELSRRAGIDDPALRAQIERGLGLLLRYQWRPGPTHLMAHPGGARGGVPGSPVDLTVRNDYVQHACSAMARWAQILAEERQGRGQSDSRRFDRPAP